MNTYSTFNQPSKQATNPLSTGDIHILSGGMLCILLSSLLNLSYSVPHHIERRMKPETVNDTHWVHILYKSICYCVKEIHVCYSILFILAYKITQPQIIEVTMLCRMWICYGYRLRWRILWIRCMRLCFSTWMWFYTEF